MDVETGRGGERVSRVTVNPKTGFNCAPKKSIYYHRILIFQGSDNRTYMLGFTGLDVYILSGNMKHNVGIIWGKDPQFVEACGALGLELTEKQFEQLGAR